MTKLNNLLKGFQSKKEFLISAAISIFFTFVMAIGVRVFFVPFQIATGGFTGVATLISSLGGVNLSVGAITFLLNLPLFLLSIKFLGSKFGVLSVIATLTYTLFLELLSRVTYLDTVAAGITNKGLAMVYGAALFGVGLGMVIKLGGSTGGSDMLANFVVSKFNFSKIGVVVFCIDATVIVMSYFVYRNIEAPLYAFLASFLSTKIIDYIIEGGKVNRAYYIFSDHAEEIGEAIIANLKRGATVITGKGVYTKQDRKMLLCLVLRHQTADLKNIIKTIDPDAFLFGTNTVESYGIGFTPLKGKKDKE